MKPLSDNLYRRLTLCKYLFRQARQILQRSEPNSRGLATSLLHDSVEICLRVLTEKLRIEIPGQGNFHKLLDNVSKRVDCVGEHSAALKRLNTARIGFKHEGLDVGATDVGAFLNSVEVFMSEVCEHVLQVDFATLSLVNAIGHRRTQNWLEKARRALLASNYILSVAHSAAAVAVYLDHRDNRKGERVDPEYYIDSDSSELYGLVDWILEYVEPIRLRFNLVSHGIDVVSYEKFESLTPQTHVGRHGTVTQHELKSTSAPSREEARFCYDFAVDSALALRDIGMPADIHRNSNSVRARVKTPCELIVNPKADPLEVIRVAEANEELLIAPQTGRILFPPDRSEFVQVIQDGDVAYVRRDCLNDGAEIP